MKKFKFILLIIVLLIIAIFIFQNIPPTSITFLIYTFYISKALLMLISAIVGFIIGLITAFFFCKRKN